MGSSSFGGWGIRTIASGEARYNPMSYHNGSVWPHDNALIAAGFARYGRREDTARVFESLFSASTYVDLRRLPELFCGFSRQRSRGPTFYPVACSPQAWAAAAPLYLLQSCLGLSFEAEASRVVFRKPALPDFLNEITLTGLSLPAGKVDVHGVARRPRLRRRCARPFAGDRSRDDQLKRQSAGACGGPIRCSPGSEDGAPPISAPKRTSSEG